MAATPAQRSPISQQRLQELLQYDPDTGDFYWRAKRHNGVAAGSKAGSMRRDGYWRIKVDGAVYAAHRLAWLYVHGAMSSGPLDHINCIRTDNRIQNLRSVDSAQNNYNKSNHSPTTGFKGVRVRESGLFEAYIQPEGTFKHLGNFRAAEEAARAYDVAALAHFGEFARLNFPRNEQGPRHG